MENKDDFKLYDSVVSILESYVERWNEPLQYIITSYSKNGSDVEGYNDAVLLIYAANNTSEFAKVAENIFKDRDQDYNLRIPYEILMRINNDQCGLIEEALLVDCQRIVPDKEKYNLVEIIPNFLQSKRNEFLQLHENNAVKQRYEYLRSNFEKEFDELEKLFAPSEEDYISTAIVSEVVDNDNVQQFVEEPLRSISPSGSSQLKSGRSSNEASFMEY